MFAPPPPAEPADADPLPERAGGCACGAAPAMAARAARRLKTLEELAEIGMDIARVLQRRVLDEAASDAGAAQSADNSLGLAFARVARAVRQTVALEDKLDRPRQAPVLTPEAERAAFLADLAQSPEIARLRVVIHRDEVRAKVEQVIAGEADGTDAEKLLADLEERLDDDEAGEDFTDRPIGELVAAICRDLGLTPDWRLWRNETWAIEEASAKSPDAGRAARRAGRSWPDAAWPDAGPWPGDAAGDHRPP
jgi:hypothetical protein